MPATRSTLSTTAFSRRRFLALSGATLLAAGALTGCSKDTPAEGKRTVVIGTLATEDFLPIWVAQQEGLFAENVEVQVQVFQSATELQAGIKSNKVDLAMTDPMVSAGIFVSGTDVRIQWITLGATATQGRFGIMVNKDNFDAGITDLKKLQNVPIGVGSNTILEYVMDKLMAQAGVPADKVKKEEIQKLPVRFQNMMSGVVTAAALPGSLLALGEANGCVCIADDTQGENISQSVMIARAAFLDTDPDGAVIEALKQGWDAAVKLINASPNAYRGLLVERANLNEVLADSYPVSDYPTCQLPSNQMIDPVISWMRDKGYLEYAITYDEATGAFAPAL